MRASCSLWFRLGYLHSLFSLMNSLNLYITKHIFTRLVFIYFSEFKDILVDHTFFYSFPGLVAVLGCFKV